jgi:hypothetical protein
MTQIFRHAHGEPTACVRCSHPDEIASEDGYLRRMAAATGLNIERLMEGLADNTIRVDEGDVEVATEPARALLAKSVGRDLCGFLSDSERLLTIESEPIQLSVAFSSYLAGTFLAAEFAKFALHFATPLDGRFQMDPLAIVDAPPPFAQMPSNGCFCQQRASVVEAIRRRSERLRSAPTGAMLERTDRPADEVWLRSCDEKFLPKVRVSSKGCRKCSRIAAAFASGLGGQRNGQFWPRVRSWL